MPRVSTASARRCASTAGRPISPAAATAARATRDPSRCAPAAPSGSHPMKLSPNSLSLDSLAALPERQRRLALGGLALAAAILIFGVLIPLDRSVAHAHERLARKRADLSWMQGVAPELAASAPPPAATGESLLVIIDRSARESGLAGALAGSEPGGPGSLSVRLAKAPFDTLVGGLRRLARQNGVSVESATLEKTAKPGPVNAPNLPHFG